MKQRNAPYLIYQLKDEIIEEDWKFIRKSTRDISTDGPILKLDTEFDFLWHKRSSAKCIFSLTWNDSFRQDPFRESPEALLIRQISIIAFSLYLFHCLYRLINSGSFSCEFNVFLRMTAAEVTTTEKKDDWLEELCGMLHRSTRLDVRLSASANVMMLTGSDEGRLFIRQNKKLVSSSFEFTTVWN